MHLTIHYTLTVVNPSLLLDIMFRNKKTFIFTNIKLKIIWILTIPTSKILRISATSTN